jgi:hypothetical protein
MGIIGWRGFGIEFDEDPKPRKEAPRGWRTTEVIIEAIVATTPVGMALPSRESVHALRSLSRTETAEMSEYIGHKQWQSVLVQEYAGERAKLFHNEASQEYMIRTKVRSLLHGTGRFIYRGEILSPSREEREKHYEPWVQAALAELKS